MCGRYAEVFIVLLFKLTPCLVYQGVDQLPDYPKVSFPNLVPRDLSEVVPMADQSDLDFLRQILVLDPKKRLTSTAACQHAYFFQHPLPVHPSSLIVPRRSAPVKREKVVTSVEEALATIEAS